MKEKYTETDILKQEYEVDQINIKYTNLSNESNSYKINTNEIGAIAMFPLTVTVMAKVSHEIFETPLEPVINSLFGFIFIAFTAVGAILVVRSKESEVKEKTVSAIHTELKRAQKHLEIMERNKESENVEFKS